MVHLFFTNDGYCKWMFQLGYDQRQYPYVGDYRISDPNPLILQESFHK